MSLTPAQLAARRDGIAATDVAAIVGCHPHRSRLDVFLEKVGAAEPFEGNERTKWGNLLEPVIREDYEATHRCRVSVPGTLRHPRRAWQMATPDGLVFLNGARTPDRGLEIKVHGRDAVMFGGLEYGAPGTDEVPEHELIQCMWNLDVSEAIADGLDRWDLVAFLDGAPAEFAIHGDDELVGILVEESERFLVDHVRTGTPPPPDGSKAWGNWLKRRWPKNTADLINIDDNPALLALAAELRAAVGDRDTAKARLARVSQQLKLAIGDRAGLTLTEPGRAKPAKITWKRSKDGVSTDWRSSFESLVQRAALAAGADDADWRATLAAIASTRPIETTTAAKRPFLAPRHWKKSADESDEKPDNTEEN